MEWPTMTTEAHPDDPQPLAAEDASSTTLDQAETAYRAGNLDAAQGTLEALVEAGPRARALLALCRVRQALACHRPGAAINAVDLNSFLDHSFSNPWLEAERAFALGWLGWLGADTEKAERHLASACAQGKALDPSAGHAESAYWLARVQLLRKQAGALAEFENILKGRAGSPRGTCWYVDLLWRAGQAGRAEQVWKTVRGNRRITAVEEACLLEARFLVRQGDGRRAEQVLTEANLGSGVLRVERNLLLAWLLAERGQVDQADSHLRQAEQGPYPLGVLETWRRLFELRHAGRPGPILPVPEGASSRSGLDPDGPLAHWLRGQEARLAGRPEEAAREYRESLGHPRLEPFGRYGLACLGQEDLARLLAGQPSPFLAARCRARLLAERFRLQQASPAEALAGFDQALQYGYRNAALDHFRELTQVLSRQLSVAELDEFALGGADQSPEVRSNRLRAAVEGAIRHLPAAQAIECLLHWSQAELLLEDVPLRQTVGVSLLHLLSLASPADSPTPEERARTAAVKARVEFLLGPGVPLVPWLLHLAAQALGRNEPTLASTLVRRALALDPELAEAGGQGDIARNALPELEKRARAQALARVVRLIPEQPLVPGDLLADAVEHLGRDLGGQAVLSAATAGDLVTARQGLLELAGRTDLTPPLAHHLAVICHRAALSCEDHAQEELADRCWRLAWPCWLRVLESFHQPGFSAEETAKADKKVHLLIGKLLGLHRQYLNYFLGSNAVAAARRHWGYVEGLIPLGARCPPGLAAALADGVARFRQELAMDFLTTTREIMKTGTIPRGWRADYEKGLSFLRRLLSLDRDNVRLLTALVDICGDWFLDCYNNEAPQTLWEQVERFTPFALKLARLVDKRPGEWAARVALAEFYKYRGFIAADRAEKISLYQQARCFNPDNDNVRQLLDELQGEVETAD
jgi:hypothetical protein